MEATQWTHKVELMVYDEALRQVEQRLIEHGRAGWELVSVTEADDKGKIFIFKKPLGQDLHLDLGVP